MSEPESEKVRVRERVCDPPCSPQGLLDTNRERVFFIGNLLVRIHFIIVMNRWTGLAPWEFEFPLPPCLHQSTARPPRCSHLPVMQRESVCVRERERGERERASDIHIHIYIYIYIYIYIFIYI